jgi:hypothetical protein
MKALCGRRTHPISPHSCAGHLLSSAHHREHCDSLDHPSTTNGGHCYCWKGSGRWKSETSLSGRCQVSYLA